MTKIFKTLYGIEPGDIQKSVVIMPFDIPNAAACLGVLPLKNGRLFATAQGHGFTLIKSGMSAGFVGESILRLKNTPCQQIFFLGTCGLIAQRPGLDIGSVITPHPVYAFESFSEIITGKLRIPAPLEADISLIASMTPSIPRHGCISFASIHEESKHMNTFKQLGAEVIEMECSAFFLAARKIQRKSSALLVISDIMGDENICFNLSDAQKKSLAKGISQACDMIKDFCAG